MLTFSSRLHATRGIRQTVPSRPLQDGFAAGKKPPGLTIKKGSPAAEALEAEAEDVGTAGLVAIGLGLASNPLVLYSEYVLKTTGSGLPPGPGGIYGAAEGIAYLVIVGIVAWSIFTKVQTGKGLPPGPSGLLGAVEGLSYLSLLAGVVVFGLTFLEKGALPGITG